MLQVLMLDKTKIDDDGLIAVAKIAPHLKYLSLQVGTLRDVLHLHVEFICTHFVIECALQDCRSVSDEGILALASPDGCINLELIDLKVSVHARF